MNTNDAKKRLRQMIKELELIVDSLVVDEPIVPQEVAELIEKKICVQCRKPLPSTPKRGDIDRYCHSACAKLVRRRIDDGEFTDEQAVSNGAWGPTKNAGRPAKPLRFSVESPELYVRDDSPKKTGDRAKKKGG